MQKSIIQYYSMFRATSKQSGLCMLAYSLAQLQLIVLKKKRENWADM